MSNSCLLQLRDGPVLELRLNRPEARNALNGVIIRELSSALRLAAEDDELRVILLTGEGPAFCAGADLHAMARAGGWSEADNVADARRLQEMFDALAAAPQATVACVHGPAVAGGAGLASACDLVIASTQAFFAFTEVRVGIIPAIVSSYVTARIGPAATRALFLTAERVPAERALQMGLADRVTAPEHFLAAVNGLIRELLAASPAAVTAAKQLLQDLLNLPRDEIREKQVQRLAVLRATDQAREGLAAALEKRAPAFAAPEGAGLSRQEVYTVNG